MPPTRPNLCTCISRLRIFFLDVTLFPDDEVAHECKRGGGVVVGHEVACAKDVVVAETALKKEKEEKRG